MNLPQREIGFLLGLPFHVVTMEETIEDAVTQVEGGSGPGYFITANADFIAQAHQDEVLRDILFHADRVVCDGMPLVWLSRYFKPVLPERVAGSDMVFRLFEEADRRRWRVYFLGSDTATLERTTAILNERYPGMTLSGTFSPPFGAVDAWPNQAILEDIRRAEPELLLVAVGCPKQEYWIGRFFKESRVPLSIGIGASLDFICGSQVRAPRWLQRIGLEWLWRLASNPKRLFKRYAKDFYYLVVLGNRQRKWTQDGRPATRVRSAEEPEASESADAAPEADVLWLRWIGAVESGTVSAQPLPVDYSKPVFLDLGEVSFMDSSGIGLLARLARDCRAAGVGFALIRPSVQVSKLIEGMKLGAQFPIFEDRESAVGSLKQDKEEGV